MIRRSLLALGLTLAAACGAGSDAATDLPPDALEGRQVVRTKGCAACHGANGTGGVGPAFVGLFGSERELQSGDTVTADRAYLVESITDPSAALVDGYNLPMPRTELSDAEVDAVIAYIEALADDAP